MILRPEDIDLSYTLRRCLDSYHQGVVVLPLEKFPVHHSTYKGHRYICNDCYNRKRRDAEIREKRGSQGAVHEAIKHSFYEIVTDPRKLFRGLFRKYDFAMSFQGGDIWAAGTLVRDEQGQEFRVQYKPEPGLLRADGTLFVLERKHLLFVERSTL